MWISECGLKNDGQRTILKSAIRNPHSAIGTSAFRNRIEVIDMRHARTIFVLIVAIALGNLACKSNSAAALAKEDNYNIDFACTSTDNKELPKDDIKKLGLGNGSR